MKKYLSIFATQFANAMEYRASIVSTLLKDAITISSIVVLWVALYRDHSTIAGYSFHDSIAYYVLVPVVGFFTQVALSDSLGREIRTGFFSNYLLKPYQFWKASLVSTCATKCNYLLFVSPIIAAVLAYLAVQGLVVFSALALCSALVIMVLAFIFHFVLDLALSYSAFWLDDTWAFRHIKTILFSVLGGLTFPLDFVPGPVHSVISFFPFQYVYYVPIMYALGKRSGAAVFAGDIVCVVLWTVCVAVAAALLWKLGLKKYGAYGR